MEGDAMHLYLAAAGAGADGGAGHNGGGGGARSKKKQRLAAVASCVAAAEDDGDDEDGGEDMEEGEAGDSARSHQDRGHLGGNGVGGGGGDDDGSPTPRGGGDDGAPLDDGHHRHHQQQEEAAAEQQPPPPPLTQLIAGGLDTLHQRRQRVLHMVDELEAAGLRVLADAAAALKQTLAAFRGQVDALVAAEDARGAQLSEHTLEAQRRCGQAEALFAALPAFTQRGCGGGGAAGGAAGGCDGTFAGVAVEASGGN